MQINKNQVIEINLKDLFFHILYRWRSILIVGLIGAIVLCGYQYMSIKKVHDAGKLTKEERQYQLDLENYKDDLESAQNTIRVNTKLLQDQNNYRKESIYFQLDPQSVWTASNKYLIKVDQSVLDKLPQGSSLDPADGILSVYSSPLSEATEEELIEAFKTDKPEYVSELVGVSTSTYDNTVTVIVKGLTKETALAGLALLDSKMKAITAEKAQEIDSHTLTLVTEDIALRADENLAKKQNELAKSIKENQEYLQEARQMLDNLEASGEPKAPGQHLTKKAVIGFIVGAAAMVFLYAVFYVIKGKLHSSHVLAVRYNLPIFGELTTTGQLHGNRGVDKLFAKWEHGKDALDDATVYDNVSALIDEKQEAKDILLVSTLPAEKISAIKDALTERLPDKVIDVKANVLRNSKGIKEAAKADAVIITEAKDESSIKNMDRMAESLIIAEANVIGAVIL